MDETQHHSEYGSVAILPELHRKRQKKHEFKTIFSYTVNLSVKLVWAT